MPEHCLPRNFEFERTQTWGGGPIATAADQPMSFLVRGEMPRSSPQSDTGDSTRIEPRGLPPPRLKTPPPPRPILYIPDEAKMDPSEIRVIEGCRVWFPRDKTPVPLLSEVRTAAPKFPMEKPVPGLSKPARGRHVPKKGDAPPNRKHPCPVKGCDKIFTKRDHLNRHITCLHKHENTLMCDRSFCNKTFTRFDNLQRHQRRHTHHAEIFACEPEDKFKGAHLQNPYLYNTSSFCIKPFAAIPIHPKALALWIWQETKRRAGEAEKCGIGYGGPLDEYFAAHPEEAEIALRSDPEAWCVPPIPPEFTPINSRCMTGTFKLDVKRDDHA